MRINRYVANALGISRRKADDLIAEGRVKISNRTASLGDQVGEYEEVSFNGKIINSAATDRKIILLNKPVGYVCSRDGQGAPTVYKLLPEEFANLIIVGRLDKDSSGLVLLTNDGRYAQELSHPSNDHKKIYEIALNKSLAEVDRKNITDNGVDIGDERPSKFDLKSLDATGKNWQATLGEGRNRQIRRTFAELGYRVVKLNRIQLGEFKLPILGTGQWLEH